MKFEDFTAGTYVQQYKYKSFNPSKINCTWTWEDSQINTLLEEATIALSRLDAFSLIVPDVDLFISMHIAKEANTSSHIEGTQTMMSDDLSDERDVDPEKRDDRREVINYILAMNQAIEELRALPLSTRLLKRTHAILMQGARGQHRTPGEYRNSQNWIGGTSLQDAVFIPPQHTELGELMSDLEKFWHNENINVPHLIRIAISHYQFETIHPFLDGNGRIGRLLIVLYLISKGLLQKPSLYLSTYFARHKSEYYDALTTVRGSNDIIHWVRFFLVAIREVAIKGTETFQSILDLRSATEDKINEFGNRRGNACHLLNQLYTKPVITIKEAADTLNVSYPTANRLIKDFESLDILQVLKKRAGKNKNFFFRQYYDLFQD